MVAARVTLVPATPANVGPVMEIVGAGPVTSVFLQAFNRIMNARNRKLRFEIFIVFMSKN
jgi:hypothetical protein